MTVTESNTTTKDGKVVSIAGPVIDVEFPEDSLPEINSALSFDLIVDGETITVLAEVAQQIGDSRVRAISLKPTDGPRRDCEPDCGAAASRVASGHGARRYKPAANGRGSRRDGARIERAEATDDGDPPVWGRDRESR